VWAPPPPAGPRRGEWREGAVVDFLTPEFWPVVLLVAVPLGVWVLYRLRGPGARKGG
jgi:hypothetical protein